MHSEDIQLFAFYLLDDRPSLERPRYELKKKSFAWQGHDFRIVRLDFRNRCSTL